ncbi:hypothetical protein [Actinokineospora sp. HUAS TT18]|uniref:hypothetical protein n=1 Tax=Actinokineospora sp. HUAS TT18 TaxID=3447451 RepID=UPI003F5244AF
MARACALAVAAGTVGALVASGPQAAQPVPDAQRAAAAAPAEPGDFRVNFRVDGWTRIAKLGSAMRVGSGQFKSVIKQGQEDPGNPGIYPVTGTLTMPPASGYFVVFRFVPVTNTNSFVQVGTASGTANMNDFPTVHADIKLALDLVITDVKQNNVPLNVGANCRSKTPIAVSIKGDLDLSAPKITPQNPNPKPAATIDSEYTIPPLVGCGVTEDLTPLLTGLVSGPKNLLRTELRLECAGCPAT